MSCRIYYVYDVSNSQKAALCFSMYSMMITAAVDETRQLQGELCYRGTGCSSCFLSAGGAGSPASNGASGSGPRQGLAGRRVIEALYLSARAVSCIETIESDRTVTAAAPSACYYIDINTATAVCSGRVNVKVGIPGTVRYRWGLLHGGRRGVHLRVHPSPKIYQQYQYEYSIIQ